MPIMTPEALARTVEDFLAGARDVIVLDDGARGATHTVLHYISQKIE